MTQKQCKEEGCLELVHAKALCKRHYRSEYDKRRYLSKKEEINNRNKRYYVLNKQSIQEKQKQYRLENKDKIAAVNHEYRESKRDHYRDYNKNYVKLRRASDPHFRIKDRVSNMIFKALKLIGSSKNNNSVVQFLPYSFQNLKDHLEKQFEPWMTWDNWGKYNCKTWDDNDPTTWTWQIDHIIPQSDLLYSSMEDENFKKCWQLSNLRPLNAKQNYLDGMNRTRHKS